MYFFFIFRTFGFFFPNREGLETVTVLFVFESRVGSEPTAGKTSIAASV